MKKVIGIALAVALLVSLVPAVALADDGNGNGAPDADKLGQVNIIGVKYDKNVNMGNVIEEANGGGNGSVIFVALGTDGEPVHSKISLVEGDSFAVLDKNATDADGAVIQLMDPDLDPYIVGQDMAGVDTDSAYSVWVRPLGKPGGWSTITTCAELLESEFESYFTGKDLKAIHNAAGYFGGSASIEQVTSPITLRTNGNGNKVQFTDVTAELLTIVFKVTIEYDDNGETVTEVVYVRVPIFDDMLQGEYWDYENHGLKLLQVRFYDYSVDVSAGDGDLPPIE
jgi:hypothetical protein